MHTTPIAFKNTLTEHLKEKTSRQSPVKLLRDVSYHLDNHQSDIIPEGIIKVVQQHDEHEN